MGNNGNIPMGDIISVADREMGDLSTLTKSIEQLGLLQPIILSPLPDGRYMVVDGRRRLAALRDLGYKVLPERAYTFAPQIGGDTALMSHAANTERKALTPSEELAQLEALAKEYTMEELATRLGRSPGWIARRLKIRNLTPKWRKVLDDPELSRLWSFEKLSLIATLPAHSQEAFDWMIDDGVTETVEELRKDIDDEIHALSGAVFDTDACAGCVYNSTCQQLLFDDMAEGCCLDPECFTRKTVAALNAKLAARPELLSVIESRGNGYTVDTYGEFPKAMGVWDLKTCRAPKEGEKPNALIVAGRNMGREMVVEFLQKGSPAPKKTAARQAAEAESKERKEPTLAEREELLAQKRNRRALELLACFLDKKFSGKEWASRITGHVEKPEHFLNVVRLYGYAGPYSRDYRCHLTRKDAIPSTDGIVEKVYDQVRHAISMHLAQEVKDTLADISREAGDAVADLCMIHEEWREIREQAAVEVPEPKELIEQRAKAQRKGGER